MLFGSERLITAGLHHIPALFALELLTLQIQPLAVNGQLVPLLLCLHQYRTRGKQYFNDIRELQHCLKLCV